MGPHVALTKRTVSFPPTFPYTDRQGKMDQTVNRREQAVEAFTTSLALELPWTQLHHICYWELIWTYAALFNWESSADFAGRMLREKYKIVVRLIPHYNAVRVATAHFNNEADIDKLVVALDEIVRGN